MTTVPSSSGPDLSVSYLGLELSGPIVISASPLTRTVESMQKLEAAGASAVILPSLFQEEVEAEELAAANLMDVGSGFVEFDSAPLADIDTSGYGPDRHVRLVEEAKAGLNIPVIASVNGSRQGGWARYATMMADAGADAVELNLYAVNTDPSVDANGVEARSLGVIEEVKHAIDVPLSVKISQNFQSLSNFAVRARDAGADGLVLFNRFFGPDIDLEELTVTPQISLSSSTELRLRMRWIGILRAQMPDFSLAATGGVHTAEDIIKTLLVGSNVACITSVLLKNGPGYVADLLAGTRSWIAERDYESVRQMCGSMSAASVGNPTEFERAQYMKAITSWSTG